MMSLCIVNCHGVHSESECVVALHAEFGTSARYGTRRLRKEYIERATENGVDVVNLMQVLVTTNIHHVFSTLNDCNLHHQSDRAPTAFDESG